MAIDGLTAGTPTPELQLSHFKKYKYMKEWKLKCQVEQKANALKCAWHERLIVMDGMEMHTQSEVSAYRRPKINSWV